MIAGILLLPAIFVCVIQNWLLQLKKSVVTIDLGALARQLRKTASDIPRNSDVSVWLPELLKLCSNKSFTILAVCQDFP